MTCKTNGHGSTGDIYVSTGTAVGNRHQNTRTGRRASLRSLTFSLVKHLAVCWLRARVRVRVGARVKKKTSYKSVCLNIHYEYEPAGYQQ